MEDIDQSRKTWVWRPPRHKNSHRKQGLTIFLGPKAREVLTDWLKTREKTGKHAEKPHVFVTQYGNRWETAAYGHEISKKAAKNGPERRWTPHQIRHARATKVRNRFGVEASQASLGHASLKAAELYSSKALELAETVAEEMG